MNLSVPLSIYAIYMAQISFYVHSLYTTILVDHWRRDSVVMVGHHVITALLLVFSLSTRYRFDIFESPPCFGLAALACPHSVRLGARLALTVVLMPLPLTSVSQVPSIWPNSHLSP